jgi:hypothetical protein
MKNKPSWVGLLPLVAVFLVSVVVGVLAPKQPTYEVSFSAVVADKVAFVGYEAPQEEKLVFTEGVLLYMGDGFSLSNNNGFFYDEELSFPPVP